MTTWPPKPPAPEVRYLLDGEVVALLRIDRRKSDRKAAMGELRRLRSRNSGLRTAYLGRSSGCGLWDREKIDSWLQRIET